MDKYRENYDKIFKPREREDEGIIHRFRVDTKPKQEG